MSRAASPPRAPASSPGRPNEERSRPVRVLFLYDHLGYPHGVTHGLTRYCLSVLPRVNGSPIDVVACFLRERHPAGRTLAGAGVEPIFLGRSRWDPRALADVVALLGRRGIDVLHAAGQKGILVGGTAARLVGCRTIVHFHDLYPLTPALRLVLRAAVRPADVALCVSDCVRRHAQREYGVRAEQHRVLHNGIEPSAFGLTSRGADWRRAAGIAPTVKAIGIIGRISAVKGHARLIDQMPGILARVPDAALVVVGDGPLRPRLQASASALGVSAAVRFVGQQEDMAAVLSALDVVAIPSDHEGLSFVALESAAAGTPVVASDVGGLREVVRHGETGLLVPLCDRAALGDAIVTLLRDPARAAQLAEGARRGVGRFAIEHHVRRLRELYLGLAGAERRSPGRSWLRVPRVWAR